MTTKIRRFTPESIQQFKEASRYLHAGSNEPAVELSADYTASLEGNLVELSARIDHIRHQRDAFVACLNADLEAIEDRMQDSLIAYAALSKLHTPG